jgi:methylated-DNA-protein-cysteine methyltransferase-like protein
MVGNAMAALPRGSDVPWQRVINARGMLSPRSGGGGTAEQRRLLLAEGVLFDRAGRVDLRAVGWHGPDAGWLAENDCRPVPPAGRAAAKHA